MRVGIIDAHAVKAELVETSSLEDALKLVGLQTEYVDHSTLTRDQSGGVGYFTDRFAFWKSIRLQKYTSIGQQLIAGSAVLHAFDSESQTIDLTNMPMVVFYGSASEVEKMIAAGTIDRPSIVIDGVCHWRWPELEDTENVIERVRRGEEI